MIHYSEKLDVCNFVVNMLYIMLPGYTNVVHLQIGIQSPVKKTPRASVIRTSQREGGEPFKDLVPDCSIPETLWQQLMLGWFVCLLMLEIKTT